MSSRLRILLAAAAPRVSFLSLVGLVVLSLTGCARGAPERADGRSEAETAALAAALDSMVATERAFSAYASTAGIKDAFLRHLAPDAIVFEPLPVPAAGKVEQWPAPSTSDWSILWEPTYAEISAAGDLGWDTGPCDIRPPASAKRKPIRGQFNSIWRRDDAGVWRLVADLGVDVFPPAAIYGESEYRAGPLPAPVVAPSSGSGRATEAAPDLVALDRGLGDGTVAGIAEGLAARMGAGGRLHHQGLPASVGPDAVRTTLDSVSGAWRLVPAGSGTARSNDLGYTYGVLEHVGQADAPDSSVYMNVWKKDASGQWQLALAVVKALR